MEKAKSSLISAAPRNTVVLYGLDIGFKNMRATSRIF